MPCLRPFWLIIATVAALCSRWTPTVCSRLLLQPRNLCWIRSIGSSLPSVIHHQLLFRPSNSLSRSTPPIPMLLTSLLRIWLSLCTDLSLLIPSLCLRLQHLWLLMPMLIEEQWDLEDSQQFVEWSVAQPHQALFPSQPSTKYSPDCSLLLCPYFLYSSLYWQYCQK